MPSKPWGLLAVCALMLLTSCQGRKTGLQAQIDASDYGHEKARRYEDLEVYFERPGNWTIKPVDEDDDNIHTLDLFSPAGLYGRFTLIRASADPGAFPDQVMQNMQRSNKSLTYEPHAAALVGRTANGFRYRVKVDGRDYEGWVVSFAQDRTEVCFLGQCPKEATAAQREELAAIMRGIHLKRLSEKPSAKTP